MSAHWADLEKVCIRWQNSGSTLDGCTGYSIVWIFVAYYMKSYVSRATHKYPESVCESCSQCLLQQDDVCNLDSRHMITQRECWTRLECYVPLCTTSIHESALHLPNPRGSLDWKLHNNHQGLQEDSEGVHIRYTAATAPNCRGTAQWRVAPPAPLHNIITL